MKKLVWTLLLPAFLFYSCKPIKTGAVVVPSSGEKIHQSAFVVDLHNDILSYTLTEGQSFDADLFGKTHLDLNRMARGGLDAQVFSVFCDETVVAPFYHANLQIALLKNAVARNPNRIGMAYNPAQLERLIAEKKHAALIGVEGGHIIENDLKKLDSLARLGMIYLTLTWNNTVPWATSAADESKTKADTLLSGQKKGLNSFGRDVVRRCNELGVMVDLSHGGDQTFWDAIETSAKPIIVSHSCAHAICPHRRNLKDNQIVALAQKGGVVFLNFYAGYLDSTFSKRFNEFFARHQTEKDSMMAAGLPEYRANALLNQKYPMEYDAIRPNLNALVDHVDHIVKLTGSADFIGLGSDFDGVSSIPLGLNGVEDFPNITAALLERGYSAADVRKILGENFLRVFNANQIGKQN